MKKPSDTKSVHMLAKQSRYESTELSETHTKELLNPLVLFVTLSGVSAPQPAALTKKEWAYICEIIGGTCF